MELNHAVIKALSSPTRIKILHRVREKPATPTKLSEEIGKSKSTIASHLATLADAGLVEKDKEEGRRRVTYAPTRKAQAIVEGRERTVKFSVASSVLSTLLGIGLLGSRFVPMQQSTGSADQGGKALTMQSADAAANGGAGGATEATAAAPGVLDTVLTVDNGLLALGAFLLLAGIVLSSYIYMLRRWEQ